MAKKAARKKTAKKTKRVTRPAPIDPLETLWIEMKMRELTNDALGRYVGRPQDFGKIRVAICRLGGLLSGIVPSGSVRCFGDYIPCPGDPKKCCPDCPPIAPPLPVRPLRS